MIDTWHGDKESNAEASAPDGSKRRWRFAAYPVIGLLVIVAVACLFSRQDIPFDRDVWIKGDPEKVDPLVEPRRDAMLKDLLATHSLEGMPRSRLIELLGNPATYAGKPANELWYPITISWDGIDPSDTVNLVVELDSHDVVKSHRMVEYHRRG